MSYEKRGFYESAVLFTCFAAAICCKLALQYYFFDFQDDKMLQAMAAQSLAEGNGLRLPLVYGANLSDLVYVPLLAWPPGYSFLLFPFYALTHDIIKSALLLDFVSTGIFFIVYLALLRKLKLPVYFTCLLLLFNGVFLAQDVLYSAPTDLLALTFLLLALKYFITLAERSIVSIAAGFLLATLCFLPILFRYLYLPVAFVFPPMLYLLGWFTNNKGRLHAGAVALAGTAFFSIILLYYLKTNTGITGNNPALNLASFELHFNNLAYLHPFFFSAFLNLDFVVQQLSKFTHYRYEAIMQFLSGLHFFIFSFTTAVLIRLALRKTFFYKQNARWLFLTAGLCTCFCIAAFLFFLSATTTRVLNPDYQTTWTYVQEERYFKFIALFLPIGTFYFLSHHTARFYKLKKALLYTLFFLLTFETVHGFYFIGRRIVPDRRAQRQTVYEETYGPFLNSFIKVHNNTGLEVVLGGDINPYFWYARGYPIKPLVNIQELNQPLFAATPVVLLVVLHKNRLPQFKTFLSKSGVKQEGEIGKLYFFSLQIAAHERH